MEIKPYEDNYSLIEEYIESRIGEGVLKDSGAEGIKSYYMKVGRKKDKKTPDPTSNRAMKQGGIRLLKDLQSEGGSRKERKKKDTERQRDVFNFEEQRIKDLSKLRMLRKEHDIQQSIVLQEKRKRLQDIDDTMYKDKWAMEMKEQTYTDSDLSRERLISEMEDLKQFEKKKKLFKKQLEVSYDKRKSQLIEDIKEFKTIYEL
jgi:hypothetical protein